MRSGLEVLNFGQPLKNLFPLAGEFRTLFFFPQKKKITDKTRTTRTVNMGYV